MVPEVIEQAAGLHEISDDNCLVVNLAHCLSRLARFHRDTVKNSLTNFVLVSYHIRDYLMVVGLLACCICRKLAAMVNIGGKTSDVMERVINIVHKVGTIVLGGQ